MIKDPVCSSDLDQLESTQRGLTSDYMGRVYYFCSEECKARFDRDPSQFAAHQSEWEEWDIPDRAWPVE